MTGSVYAERWVGVGGVGGGVWVVVRSGGGGGGHCRGC